MSRSRRKPRDPYAQLVATLRLFAVDAVLDVGANRGQYARRLRRYGYAGPIVSWEPLPDLREELARASESDPDWHVAPAAALGSRDGTATLERSAESDMSSLLPQSPLLRKISPTSAPVARLEVPLQRLDRCVEIRPDWERMFLKVDVQGYELEVVRGAEGLGRRLAGVQLEASLVPLYQGECGFRVLLDRMEAAGFALYLLIPGYYERKLGRQLQVDLVFFRPEVAPPPEEHTQP